MSSETRQPIDSQRPSHGPENMLVPGTIPYRNAAAAREYVDLNFGIGDYELADHIEYLRGVVDPDHRLDRPTQRRTVPEGAWLRGTVMGRTELPRLFERNGHFHIPRPTRFSGNTGISLETLELLQRATGDYGHLDAFFREADEAFVDALTDDSGNSRIPIPLLIPLGTHCFMSFYVFLIRDDQEVSNSWEAYHARVGAVMERVARDLGVLRGPNLLYVRLVRRDRGAFDAVGRYMRQRETQRNPVLHGEWPQVFSSEILDGRWVENRADMD